MLSTDTRLLVERNRMPSVGEDVEPWLPSPTAGASPMRKDFSCTQRTCTGLSVKLWHVWSHLSTTQQTGTHIRRKPGPYVEDDTVIVAERDFRNSSSTTFSF